MPNYLVQSQRRTVQVLSPSQVLDVEEIGATTTPSGIYFQMAVPYESWLAVGSDAFLTPLATAIENEISSGQATGAVWRQDVDDAGLLTDFIDFTVTIPPAAGRTGPMSTIVSVPTNLLVGDPAFFNLTVAPLFANAISALQATAAL
jgi:hypothetical protein